MMFLIVHISLIASLFIVEW